MNRPTNKTIIEKYLNHFRHSNQSVKMRGSSLNYFFEEKYFNYSGHVFDIDTSVLIDYFEYLNNLDSISIKTKKNKWSIINSFLNFTMEYYQKHEFIVIIPNFSINWKKTHKKPESNKTIIANIEEIQAILNYLKIHNYKHYLIFRMFIETGMRKGEVINAKYPDLKLEERYSNGIGKTGEKIYYFSENYAKHLRIYFNQRIGLNIEGKELFINKHLRKYSIRGFNLILKNVCSKLGIKKNITCHTFRRTLNTLRKKMGCDNDTAKILIGHKTRDVNIESYTIFNYDDFIALYDKWNPYQTLNL